MPPDVLEFLAPVVVIISIGTFILIGMRMRLTAKRHAQGQLPREEVERLADAVEYLNDQVRTMGENLAELSERVDFAERLLTAGRGSHDNEKSG